MSLEILIYNNGQGTTGSLTPSLDQAFNDHKVKTTVINASHIQGDILQPSAARKMLVIPGIAGETCNYSDELDATALESIRNFAAEGGIILSICAGSYFLSRQTIYSPSWGPHKERKSLAPLFNGVAHGPISYFATAPGAEPRFGHVVVVPVNYKDLSNQWRKAGVCYGNGPGLYPDRDESGFEVLAHFVNKDAGNGPAAILRKQIGEGALYMSSVLPEIGYQAVANNAGLESALTLMAALKPHETQRQDLWITLTGRIKKDLKL